MEAEEKNLTIVAELEQAAADEDAGADRLGSIEERLRGVEEAIERAIGEVRSMAASVAGSVAPLSAASEAAGRRTVPAGMLGKEPLHAGEAKGNAHVLDEAFRSLSIEQRILMKSEMVRAGLL